MIKDELLDEFLLTLAEATGKDEQAIDEYIKSLLIS
ncbi:unnamed protein product [Bacillus thuringiensis DB27]|uniref:Uncharacterized protein n=1 Tax=Bacillus thuringiensis DB27 TaxID=1431339 RepID=W8Z740_BACTU|nr:unnamed protein product [Bacillus thuringiensis DB27]